eukprot:TRINITY_DN12979_c0_g1_i4.p1 TRINITY_DN12979_c0_g1~~TRINITY_DN12979_c0_g1_i4.p1  ORF type:complete len:461 (+),score=42.15 TRINITY_DN12979_c0_g1_i4:1966-3348(+)
MLGSLHIFNSEGDIIFQRGFSPTANLTNITAVCRNELFCGTRMPPVCLVGDPCQFIVHIWRGTYAVRQTEAAKCGVCFVATPWNASSCTANAAAIVAFLSRFADIILAIIITPSMSGNVDGEQVEGRSYCAMASYSGFTAEALSQHCPVINALVDTILPDGVTQETCYAKLCADVPFFLPETVDLPGPGALTYSPPPVILMGGGLLWNVRPARYRQDSVFLDTAEWLSFHLQNDCFSFGSGKGTLHLKTYVSAVSPEFAIGLEIPTSVRVVDLHQCIARTSRRCGPDVLLRCIPPDGECQILQYSLGDLKYKSAGKLFSVECTGAGNSRTVCVTLRLPFHAQQIEVKVPLQSCWETRNPACSAGKVSLDPSEAVWRIPKLAAHTSCTLSFAVVSQLKPPGPLSASCSAVQIATSTGSGVTARYMRVRGAPSVVQFWSRCITHWKWSIGPWPCTLEFLAAR